MDPIGHCGVLEMKDFFRAFAVCLQTASTCFQMIQDLQKKAKAGKAVDEDDIPPPVSVKASAAVTVTQPPQAEPVPDYTAPSQPPAPVPSQDRQPEPKPRTVAPPPPTQPKPAVSSLPPHIGNVGKVTIAPQNSGHGQTVLIVV